MGRSGSQAVPETIVVERPADGYAVLTLDRPDKLNALSPTMLEEIVHAVETLGRDDTLRVIVIRGSGDRAFCAGGDLDGMTLATMAEVSAHAHRAGAPFETVETVPKLVVAAVDGLAIGGGVELALACDLVLASERSRFSLPEMRHGLTPAYALVRAMDVIGRRRLAGLVFTQETLSAVEARDAGLVNVVVADAEFDAAWQRLAERLTTRPPLAVAAAKRVLNAGAGAAYRRGAVVATGLLASDDVREGRAAFSQRRGARFSGR